MSYLEQLKKLKLSAKGTAFTAKSTSDSKGSSDLARFQKSTPPSGSKDSSVPTRFQKTKPPIGSKGSSDIRRFQEITSPGFSGEAPSTTPPARCNKGCEYFHLSTVANLSPVARCWQVQDGKHWSATRLDRMTICPLTTGADPTTPVPTKTPTTTGPEVVGLACGGCGSIKYKRVANGYTFPDGTVIDGWHCGAPGCGVKLLVGNKYIDRSQPEEAMKS